jgi:hypothetical protein
VALLEEFSAIGFRSRERRLLAAVALVMSCGLVVGGDSGRKPAQGVIQRGATALPYAQVYIQTPAGIGRGPLLS